ncbi:DUF6282 family protein [Chloroflexota bacterium]
MESILSGSIDMHMHTAPDPRAERRLDALQAALQAQEAGMRAIVLKSHEYPTAPLAYIVNQIVPDVTVLGSISLDLEVGGLNPHALEASAKLGAKVVWMPTLTSANDMKKKGGGGIVILDKEGRLLPVIGEILSIVKDYRMVLATGHVSVAESFALVDFARKEGLEKIVVTHPLLEWLGAPLSLEEQCQMAEKGAYIEHCFSVTMPMYRLDPMKIVEAVRAVGAERCIISTDMGQDNNPAPAEGIRVAIATMLKCGLSEKEVELMVKINPARLLDLD